jgi:hypothetical protein
MFLPLTIETITLADNTKEKREEEKRRSVAALSAGA